MATAVDTVHTIHEFGYVGCFSAAELVAAGVALGMVLAMLTAWRCGRDRWRLAAALLPLRLVAIALLLWILAEPTSRTSVRTMTPKTLAILLDASGSMSVADRDDDTLQVARWAACQDSATPPITHLRTLDEAVFALNAIRSSLQRMDEPVSIPTQYEAAVTQRRARFDRTLEADAAKNWLRIAAQRLETLTDMGDALPIPAVKSTQTAFEQDVRPHVEEWLDSPPAGGAQPGSPVEPPDERVITLLETLDGMVKALSTAAQALAQRLESRGDRVTRETMQRARAQARRHKTAALLQHLEGRVLGQIGQQPQVLRYWFHQEVTAFVGKNWDGAPFSDPAAAVQRTDLTAALARIERDAAAHSVQAVLLLTDGAHNAGSDPAAQAAAMGGPPVYVVPVGQTRPLRDVRLHALQGPRSVFQNDRMVIEATVDATDCAGETLQIELVQDNAVLDRQSLTVERDTFLGSVLFERMATQQGLAKLQVRVIPLPEEATDENNRGDWSVEVTQGVIRVLLAERLPRWEFRFLRNLLSRDERVQSRAVLFDPPRVQEGADPFGGSERVPHAGTNPANAGANTPALPDDLESWSRFNVVILGDLAPEQLTPQRQAQLRDYVVLRGGVLIVIAGTESDAPMPGSYIDGLLGPALPVQIQARALSETAGYDAVLSPEGREADAVTLGGDAAHAERLWSQPFALRALSAFATPRPTAHVWLHAVPLTQIARTDAEPLALLCWHRYGKGRVVYFSAPITYRLRFGAGDRYHYRFWGQLLRWCVASDLGVGSSTVHLTTDKSRYASSEPVVVTVRLRTLDGRPVERAPGQVMATGDRKLLAQAALVEDNTTPGVYKATLRDLPAGRATISVTGPAVEELLLAEGYDQPVATEVTIETGSSPELLQTRCNLALLSQIAEATGGQVVTPTAVPLLINHLDWSAEWTQEVHERATWPRWSVLAALIGALAIEWFVGKRAGLV